MIRLLIIFILIIIVLSLLGVNIASLMNNKTLKENFVFVWDWTTYIWTIYLQEPVTNAAIYTWKNILKPVFSQLNELINRKEQAT